MAAGIAVAGDAALRRGILLAVAGIRLAAAGCGGRYSVVAGDTSGCGWGI